MDRPRVISPRQMNMLIYGGNFIVVIFEVVLLGIYLMLAWMAAMERPP